MIIRQRLLQEGENIPGMDISAVEYLWHQKHTKDSARRVRYFL
jgi:hypothetical protein